MLWSDYPIVTEAHVEAARKYKQEHPRTEDSTPQTVPSSWKLKSRQVFRPKE